MALRRLPRGPALSVLAYEARSPPCDPAESILYFGMPVVLLTTENDDETANIAPISSAWVLGQNVVLGLGDASHAVQPRRTPELVLNVAVPDLWAQVERRAPLTGVDPVPESRRAVYQHEPDKFAPQASPLPTSIS